MSRSTDGGQTWEPMKVIMDMGEYGGLSRRQNGAGDPCILYNPQTNTLWVAAVWISGLTHEQTLWWNSKPGMTPEETGQFMITRSSDNGLTWSNPISLTQQIKNPVWQLIMQGPGRGITLQNGTMIFPAQFKMDTGDKAIDGGQYKCHSTIVYSTDGGASWRTASGAKTNTTESQVVELPNGSLMINMRDDRNRSDKGETNGRAVATTDNMGATWVSHPSTNSALPESNCMASLISTYLKLNDTDKYVLLFSNPDDKYERAHMTIKASLDQGLTWPVDLQTEIYEDVGFGYSCLTMVNKMFIGILYEGVRELYFQKIPVKDLLGD